MATMHTLRIHNAELIGMLISSAEGMHDVEIDEARELLGDKTKSVLDSKDVHFHFNRACAIQEVVEKLKHASLIPPPSHKHPTIIPLSSQHQVDVVSTIIDFAYDWQNDTVTEPLWGLRACLPTLTHELVDSLRAEMNEGITRLVAITELKTIWQEELR